MTENVGKWDAVVRSVVGPSLMGMALVRFGARRGEPGGLALLVAGTLLTESALTRVCPMYKPFGIDTRNFDQRAEAAGESLAELLES
jgi:hypothetical protein